METHVRPDGSDQEAVHLSTDEARAGATPHVTRNVLGWGLALVLVGFAVVLAIYMVAS
ncbi:hypothetical protein [Rhizorhabdus phycosphaerae]|uniref:hypothetical protein n=1 Tax=Rhizorhabdus phycosphaerae TaxID=2711156 RepID=UPI0013ED9309|nr:hypothetical protein [Rhizorhabdus phycosphaerae]